MTRLILLPLAAAIAAAAPAGPATVTSGVERWRAGDYQAAVAAWLPFAAQGDAAALFNLGQAYKLGRGVPRDPALARDYYRRSAEKNYVPAAANLGIALYQAGDKLEAVRWLRQAADHGDARAQYVLGIAAWNGDGLPKNPGLAYGYLLRAQAGGIGEATTALGSIEPTLSPQAHDAGVAMAASLASGGGVPAALAAVPTSRTTPVGVQRPGATPPATVAGTFVAGVRNAFGLTPPKPVPTPTTARTYAPPAARADALPVRSALNDAAARVGPAHAVVGPPSPDTAVRPAVAESKSATRAAADVAAAAPPPRAATADAPPRTVPVPTVAADTAAKPPLGAAVVRPAAGDAASRSPAKPALAEAGVKEATVPAPGDTAAKPAAKAALLDAKASTKPGDTGGKPAGKAALADAAADKPSLPGWRVQLGAYSSRKLADAAWASVRASQGGAIGKARPIFDTAGAVVKVQLGPYATRDAARDACSKLAFAGKACFVTQG